MADTFQHISIIVYIIIPISQLVAIYRDPLGDSIFNRADAATISTIHSNSKILNMSDDSVGKDKTIENRYSMFIMAWLVLHFCFRFSLYKRSTIDLLTKKVKEVLFICD